MRSYAFAKYGHEDAHRLAEEFAHRANYFARLYFDDEGDGVFHYRQVHFDGVPEHAGFADWLCTLSEDSEALDRLAEIKHMFPRPSKLDV